MLIIKRKIWDGNLGTRAEMTIQYLMDLDVQAKRTTFSVVLFLFYGAYFIMIFPSESWFIVSLRISLNPIFL